MTLHSRLPHLELHQQRVIVRFDGNVPLSGTTIMNDYRLQALLPTLHCIKNKGGTMTLITHLGRPKNREPELSTNILVPWFEAHGFTSVFAPDIQHAHELSLQKTYDIVLLENVRFFRGEKARSSTFAHELARLGDYYVNDAFATLHRTDSSVTLLAELFAPSKRTIGLLVEKELQALSALLKPTHPFVVIVGGGKPETKVPVIKALLDVADTIIIVPALNLTFNKALGKPVGRSLVDESLGAIARAIVHEAATSTTQLMFPTDYRIAYTKKGPLTTVSEKDFPHDGIGISLGPESMAAVLDCIGRAKTVFFNGTMGFPDAPETLTESCTLLAALAASQAYTVIAGGNSLDLVFRLHKQDAFNYLSTGGGATLAYIAGEPLPGLAVFMHDAALGHE